MIPKKGFNRKDSYGQYPSGVLWLSIICARGTGLLGTLLFGERLNPSLSYTIMRLATVLQRRLEGELRSSLQITSAQFRALDVIQAHPGIGSAALGRELLITPQSAGSVVNSLLRVGLVQRDTNARPGTLMGLTLTKRGVKALMDALEIVERVRKEDEAPLSQQEIAVTQRTLARLLNALTDGDSMDSSHPKD